MRFAALALLAAGCTRGNPDMLAVQFPDMATARPLDDERCGASVVCGNRGSYAVCTRGIGAQCQARFLVSDGASFGCASCGDCAAAQTNLVSWCNATTTPTTTTTGGECASTSVDLCQACCKTNHYSGWQYIQSKGKACVCQASVCGYDCSDHCLNNASGDAACQECVDTYFGFYCSDEVEAVCLTNAECSAYRDCWMGCG